MLDCTDALWFNLDISTHTSLTWSATLSIDSITSQVSPKAIRLTVRQSLRAQRVKNGSALVSSFELFGIEKLAKAC